MGGLERQVADYHEREEEVQRLATESKQKVEDALSLKDQASAREDHSYREVNRLMDERGVMILKRQVCLSHPILQRKDGRVIINAKILSPLYSRTHLLSSALLCLSLPNAHPILYCAR